MSLNERINDYHILHEYLNREANDNVCEKFGQIGKVNWISNIGSKSKNGEVKLGCISAVSDDTTCLCLICKKVALKMIPLYEHEYKDIKTQDDRSLDTAIGVEIACLVLVNNILKEKISPNFPFLYSITLCNDCNFANQDLINDFTSRMSTTKPVPTVPPPVKIPCLNMYVEYANAGDVKTWLTETRSPFEWLSMYFQVFSAIYVLQSKFNMVHNDLHWGNVLVYKIPEGDTVLEYKLGSSTWHVPNTGWLFVIWDFGYAHIPNKLIIESHKNMEKKQSVPMAIRDYQKLSCTTFWAQMAYTSVHVPDEAHNFTQFAQLACLTQKPVQYVLTFFNKFFPFNKNNIIYESYDLDKPLNNDNLPIFMLTEDGDSVQTPVAQSENEILQCISESIKKDAVIMLS